MEEIVSGNMKCCSLVKLSESKIVSSFPLEIARKKPCLEYSAHLKGIGSVKFIFY